MSEQMIVEVAYALEHEQFLFELSVPENCTAKEAVESSPLIEMFPDLDYSKLGVFSKPVQSSMPLRERDRVEIYRPLKADPRERRRKKVEDERKKSLV
jgi:putative ubiquitin-RnfH superfamily antitoxin RatB of RatAB toxin-antitoxin module